MLFGQVSVVDMEKDNDQSGRIVADGECVIPVRSIYSRT